MIKIEPIKAFNDNYIWLLSTNEGLVAVDPGDAKPVLSYLDKVGKNLSHILITHHHFDHTGGAEELSKKYGIEVYGPTSSIYKGITKELKEGDIITVIGINFTIIEIPGHTLDHIAYYSENDNNPILFCGDTLFAGGCGRVFEGTCEQMYESLLKLKKLPLNTQIYCGHEYTQSNLAFALKVEKENSLLHKRMDLCVESRKNNKPTIPSLLEVELQTNPFLRSDKKSVQKCIMEKFNLNETYNDIEIFTATRKWKDDS